MSYRILLGEHFELKLTGAELHQLHLALYSETPGRPVIEAERAIRRGMLGEDSGLNWNTQVVEFYETHREQVFHLTFPAHLHNAIRTTLSRAANGKLGALGPRLPKQPRDINPAVCRRLHKLVSQIKPDRAVFDPDLCEVDESSQREIEALQSADVAEALEGSSQ